MSMTEEQKQEIEKISKDFARGFKPNIPHIAGSGWMIVDPLAGYLNFSGYENALKQLPETPEHPQILIIEFKDGTKFIPAGSDLNMPSATDWMWLDK